MPPAPRGRRGSVVEPYAIAARFTNSSIDTFIADGSTLGEAFAKSVATPDVQMPLGDMLAQPYADVPKVAITSSPGNYGTARGTISIGGSATLVRSAHRHGDRARWSCSLTGWRTAGW